MASFWNSSGDWEESTKPIGPSIHKLFKGALKKCPMVGFVRQLWRWRYLFTLTALVQVVIWQQSVMCMENNSIASSKHLLLRKVVLCISMQLLATIMTVLTTQVHFAPSIGISVYFWGTWPSSPLFVVVYALAMSSIGQKSWYQFPKNWWV